MSYTFIDALLCKPTSYTPVWYMRQAGRYLPSYRQLKGDKNILDIVKNPSLASQICLQPVEQLGVDAAILYADIMIPLLGIGVDLEIIESIGPVIKKPIENLSDVQRLNILNPAKDIPYLLETIGLVLKKLDHQIPLIGFSAAPFTLASYLIEGKPSRDFVKTKQFMYTQKEAWRLLMAKLSDLIITYLKAQKEAGVEALQLFDSWVGVLSETDYQEFVLNDTAKVFKSLSDGIVPLIYFGTNTWHLFDAFASVECDAVGIDWRIPLDKLAPNSVFKKAIQGNLDPAVCLASFSEIQKSAQHILNLTAKRQGFVFNLGHGVLPSTDYQSLKKLTEFVHQQSRR